MSKDTSIESAPAIATTRLVDQQLPPPTRAKPQRHLATEVEKALKELKAAAASQMVELDMHLDSELNLIVVSVREGNHGKVIRQIPPEEAVQLAHMLKAGRLRLIDRLF
jgi:flagellar protein FlaG